MISTPGYWRRRSAFAMTAAATACWTPQPVTPGSAAETLLHWLQRQAMEL
ncbi:Uncharacterised protein [Serratia rubidaea]|uniref:Uncharacterized protein n=1 Tax=Serratia rubidaea TaxID=61652 RepID=A0A4U9HHP7_SERRU|nr:Uncharacterised protein [Serratia rubidaea]